MRVQSVQRSGQDRDQMFSCSKAALANFPDAACVFHIVQKARRGHQRKLPSGLHARRTRVLAVEDPPYGPLFAGEVLGRHDQLLVRAFCRD